MRWQAVLAGALASALVTAFGVGAALAEVRIESDPGGEVSSYIEKFQDIRAAGEHVVIDGPCLSACTLLTGIVPPDHVCVTANAVLGFRPGKAASWSCGFIRRRSGPGSVATAGFTRSSSCCAAVNWRRSIGPVRRLAAKTADGRTARGFGGVVGSDVPAYLPEAG
jgi:hypothetical protein